MKLEDTINLIMSDDWRDRLNAEYCQLRYRMDRLKDAIDNPPHSLKDSMSIAILMKQYDAMESYKMCLEKRATISGINLIYNH